ncbi:unnamed protein product, partial [Mesorhabditis spiculigera]
MDWRPIALLGIFFVLGTPASKNASSNVEDWINVWKEVSQNGFEALERLQKLSTKADSIMSLGGPIGGLIAIGLKAALQPESQELQAIKDLANRLEAKMEQLLRHQMEGFRYANYLNARRSWFTDVKDRLSRFEAHFDDMIKRPERMYTQRESFKKRCEELDHQFTIQLIAKHFVINCKISTKAQVNRANAAEKALRQIESSLPAPSFTVAEELKQVRARYLIGISHSVNLLAYPEISRLTNARPKSVEELMSMLRNITDPDAGLCLPENVYQLHYGSRKALEFQYLELEEALRHTMLYASVCGSLLHENDEAERELDRQKMAQKVSALCNHAARWLRAKQEDAWPAVPEAFLRTQFEHNKNYDPTIVADLVQQGYEDRGLKRHEYHVFVRPRAAVAMKLLETKDLTALFRHSQDSQRADKIWDRYLKALNLFGECGFTTGIFFREELWFTEDKGVATGNYTINACGPDIALATYRWTYEWRDYEYFYRGLMMLVL